MSSIPPSTSLFDRKQKPAGILLTSVSRDASGQKSWNHSFTAEAERYERGESERERERERERSSSQGGSNYRAIDNPLIYLRLGPKEQTLNSHHWLIESSLMKADTSIGPCWLLFSQQYPASLTGWKVNSQGGRTQKGPTSRSEPLTENNWTTATTAWKRNRERTTSVRLMSRAALPAPSLSLSVPLRKGTGAKSTSQSHFISHTVPSSVDSLWTLLSSLPRSWCSL